MARPLCLLRGRDGTVESYLPVDLTSLALPAALGAFSGDVWVPAVDVTARVMTPTVSLPVVLDAVAADWDGDGAMVEAEASAGDSELSISTPATGSGGAAAAAVLVFGQILLASDVEDLTIVVTDYLGVAYTFKCDSNASITQTATLRRIVTTGPMTPANFAIAFAAAVNGAVIGVTASIPIAGNAVVLTQDDAGVAGNTTITTGLDSEHLHVTGFAGGSDNVGATQFSAVRGRPYLVVDDVDAQTTALVVRAGASLEVDGSTETLPLEEPLDADVADGGGVFGFRTTIDLDDADLDTVGRGLVRFAATLADGSVLEWDQDFHVCWTLPAPTLTPVRLKQSQPSVARLLKPEQDLGELIESVFDNRVIPELEAKGIEVWQVRSWSRLEPYHAIACLQALRVDDESQTRETIEKGELEVKRALDLALASRQLWVDQPGNELEAPPDPSDDTPKRHAFTRVVR